MGCKTFEQGPTSSAGGSGGGDEIHNARVAAVKRLFEKGNGNEQRNFRHELYAHIAMCAPEVWKMGYPPRVTSQHLETALTDPKSLPHGSRPHRLIVEAWDRSFQEAFGLVLERKVGQQNKDDGP